MAIISKRSLHSRTKSDATMINFDNLVPRLLDGRWLNRLIYFKEGKNISEKLTERLHSNYHGSTIHVISLPIFL